MVVEVFLILGAIMLLGFFADLLFSKTKIPGDLILILVGVILGPIMGIVQPSFFVPFSALVGTLALIVILFEAGLNLNLFKVLSELSTATWFTLLVFLLSVSLSTAFLH
ncbi:cation:proton antiporter, partial [Candidatus Micrarchaeota archaeon]|nr:cation:proton antiporter [Candidatus Micrarchaeota archaeon]